MTPVLEKLRRRAVIRTIDPVTVLLTRIAHSLGGRPTGGSRNPPINGEAFGWSVGFGNYQAN